MTIKLPLSIAILSALVVRAEKDLYAVPLASVEQIVDIPFEGIKTIQGHEVFVNRGQTLPLLRLGALLGSSASIVAGNLPVAGDASVQRSHVTVVIVNRANAQVGLAVDEIISQQQILIKGLQNVVKGTGMRRRYDTG